jgi:hypothetical protein
MRESREMSCLLSVIVVDNEAIYEPSHRSAHPQWAKYQGPQDFIEEVASSGHDKDADSQEDDFGKERIEPE